MVAGVVLGLMTMQGAWAGALTMEEAIARVQAEGLGVSSARLTVQQREAALLAAQRAWQPSLSASAGATLTHTLESGNSRALGPSLTTQMPLYAGGSIAAGRDGAEAGLAAARSQASQAGQDAAWAVIEGFLALAEAEAQVRAAAANQAAEEALLKQVDARVDVGARTLADRYAQQAAVQEAVAAVLARQQAVTVANLSLVYTLRLSPAESWSFAVPSSAPMLSRDPTELVAQAKKARPEFEALQAAVSAAEAEKTQARAGWLPSADLSAGVSATQRASGDVAAVWTKQAWVGVDVGVPIWDRGAAASRIDQAAVGVEQAALALADAGEQVEIEVRKVLGELSVAEQSVKAANARVEAAKKALVVMEDRYQNGAATLVEVAAAQNVVEAAIQQQIAAETAQRHAQWLLAWWVGAV